MEQIGRQYPADCVINMDETSWKLLNYGFVTVAKRDNETVDCLFDNDLKMCRTAIDAAGGQFLLWVLCHGKMQRREHRYRDTGVRERCIRHGELVLLHQENGCTNTEVALDYVRWLQSRFAGGEIVLMWDVFAAHRVEEAKLFA
jgi:hypothetical protein